MLFLSLKKYEHRFEILLKKIKQINMKKIVTIMLGLLIATSMLSACKKKEVVGPTGPAGPTGNANVKSFIIETTAADWAGDQVTGYQAGFEVPIITDAIADNGAVMCYVVWGNSGYLALPYSYNYGTYTRYWSFEYLTEYIYLKVKDDDGYTPNPGDGLAMIKVVAISSTGLMQNPNLDLTDYEAVKEAFDL